MYKIVLNTFSLYVHSLDCKPTIYPSYRQIFLVFFLYVLCFIRMYSSGIYYLLTHNITNGLHWMVLVRVLKHGFYKILYRIKCKIINFLWDFTHISTSCVKTFCIKKSIPIFSYHHDMHIMKMFHVIVSFRLVQ